MEAKEPGGTVDRKVHTVEEARLLLGLGRNLMYDAVRRGDIPSVKIGRRILVPKEALDTMLAKG